MKQTFSVILSLSILISVLSASDDTDNFPPVDTNLFPSYALVIETRLPVKEPQDLAYRLQGMTDITVLAHSSGRHIGAIERFNISSIQAGGTTTITTRLGAIGDHVYIWLEDTIIVDEQLVTNLAQRFDREVYEFVRDLWGSEPPLGIDEEARLHIVITNQLRRGIGGYFSSGNSYPAMISPNSNEYDMLVLADYILTPENIDIGLSSAAHEFQHMIHHSRDRNETNWLNEGLATFTEYRLGLDTSTNLLNAFALHPQTSLTMWGLGENRQAEYGSAMMFMLYLQDRFGLQAVQQIAADSDNGLQSVDNMLRERNQASVDVIFADWVLANLLRQNSGHYAYQTLTDVNSIQAIDSTIGMQTGILDQYATQYYHYSDIPSSTVISLQMSDTIALIPTQATSGNMLWYSQRGDNSNSRLTRRFDLRNVQSANLDFNIWYDLEDEWDYAYITVSSDGGQTWQAQVASHMTSNNSNQRAYALGYTGQSGTWLAQTLPLDSYVGQQILVRFEMVTDDAINYNGVALDDIRLDAIGYSADLELTDGEWVSEGWIWTDNRLPQRAWVQIIEHNAEPIVHRFLAQGNETWQQDFNATTQSVTIAISPFAPMTTQTTSYTLQVD